MKREACGALSCIGYKLIFFFFFCHKHFTIFTTEGALDECEKGRRRRRRRSCASPATETFLHSRCKTTAAISQARCASRRLHVRLFTRGARRKRAEHTACTPRCQTGACRRSSGKSARSHDTIAGEKERRQMEMLVWERGDCRQAERAAAQLCREERDGHAHPTRP